MENNEKTSFFNYIKDCICDFEKYPEMATKPTTTIYRYFIKLVAVVTIVATIVTMCDISKKIKTTLEILKNDIPEFSIENNQLSILNEEEVIIENEESLFNFIIINTNELDDKLQEKYDEYLRNNKVGIALLNDKIEISIGSSIVYYSYEDITNVYNINNKQQIIDYFSQENSIVIYVTLFAMLFVYLYCTYIVSTFLDAIVLGSIGYVTALILKIRIRFTAMIKMAIHGLTLPIILNSIYIMLNGLTGIEIKYFSVMYMGIAYVYIITSILMIKADLIKRQSELTRIVTEQENIKKELESQEEEERKEQEEKNKKEQQKKEDDDKEEGEPQGENA